MYSIQIHPCLLQEQSNRENDHLREYSQNQVPVEQEDWIQYTADMIEAGKAAYRAAQTRDQATVSEVTNVIADACYNCHEAYRDKPGGTVEDPSNKAARCIP